MKRFAVICGIGLLLSLAGRTQETRNLEIAPPTPPQLAANGDYYALVIGIDNYKPPLPALKTAVFDADMIAEVLKQKYGFKDVKLLENEKATRMAILNGLNEYRQRLGDRDNLLIYYAGHGYEDKVSHKAYWIPADADSINSPNRIIADDLTTSIADQNARHVLVISDSCYSGGLNRAVNEQPTESGANMLYINRMMNRRSRTLMASGGTEPVQDDGTGGHSVFAYHLLDSLQHPQVAIFTGTDLLYGSVRGVVAGHSPQTPQYSTIQNSNDDAGDFVFVLNGVKLPLPATTDPHVPGLPALAAPGDKDMSQIQDLLNRYVAAVNNRDTHQVKSVWPTAMNTDLDHIKMMPRGARIGLTLASASLLDTNENAVVRCKQTFDLNGTARDAYVSFLFGRLKDGWIINQILPSN